jgi:hypothetical protein
MHRRSLCGGALALASLAGCRSDRAVPAAAVEAVTPAAAAGPATTAPNVVTFTSNEYGYQGPKEIPAGLTVFRFANRGKELHHLVIVRLDGGMTYDSLVAALKKPGPPPAWAHPVGGPNAAEPAGESNATQDLPAGHYAVLCFIPSADGVPHVAKGMIQSLEVTPNTSAAILEQADIVITLKDYTFDLSTPLISGRHVIRVENGGPQWHEVVLVKFAPGKTMADLAAWEQAGEKGPPPGTVMGGMSPMEQSAKGQFTVELTPGNYALLCFLPDSKDGKPHLMHGMAKPVTVG